MRALVCLFLGLFAAVTASADSGAKTIQPSTLLFTETARTVPKGELVIGAFGRAVRASAGLSDRTEGRYDFALLHEHGGHSGAFESYLSAKHGIYRSGPMSAAMMVSGGADKIYGAKPFYAVMLRAPLTAGDETIEATVSPWARKGLNEVVARELGVSPAVGIDAGFALHLIERLDLLFESRFDFSYGKDSNALGLTSGLEYCPLERATLQLAFYEKPVGRGPAVGLVAVRAHIALAAL